MKVDGFPESAGRPSAPGARRSRGERDVRVVTRPKSATVLVELREGEPVSCESGALSQGERCTSSENTSLYASPSSPVRSYASVGVASSMRVGRPVIRGTWPVELVSVAMAARFQLPSMANLQGWESAEARRAGERGGEGRTDRRASRQRGQ